MTLDMKELKLEEDPAKTTRAKAAQRKKQEAKAEPTWEEAWAKVFGLKSTDQKKAIEVKEAAEAGELSLGIPSLKKLSWKTVSDLWKALQKIRKSEKLAEMVKHTPKNYKLIQTVEDLDKLFADLKKEPVIAFDTETTGVDVYTDELVGMSFTLPLADYHVYIPVAHNTTLPQLRRLHVLNRLRKVLESPTPRKVAHNARFDIHMLIRYGIRLGGMAHDTMIAQRVLNENEDSVALKYLGTRYGKYFGFEEPSAPFEELFGKDGKFAEVPLDAALVYAAKDTHLTWNLYQWQKEHMKKVGFLDRLYREIENPLIDVVVEMEQTGFLVDLEFAKVYGEELAVEIAGIEAELNEAFGEVNFNSPIQLAVKLYDELQLPDPKGNRSTDVKTLKKLKGLHKGIEPLLKYRELTKLKGTYVDALPGLVKKDGRIHGSFNQLSTVTGRFSSNNPNLQNLPPRARKLIIAPEGFCLLGSDFSQIEPRVLAHMSGDKHFQEPYLIGQDLYSTLASRVFKVPIDECGDGTIWRKKMKVGLLAVMYGTSMWTLSDQLGITVEEAEQFIFDFYEAYPEVHEFIRETWEFVKNNEYVLTMYHRKRRFPGHGPKARLYDSLAAEICKLTNTKTVPLDFWDKEKYNIPYKLKRQFQDIKGEVERVRRMAVNARIQGSAADIMKLALINLYRLCRERGWRVTGTVHDEALVLVPNTITLEEVREIEACMVRAANLEVPVKVDTELMTRWGEGQKKGEWFQRAA